MSPCGANRTDNQTLLTGAEEKKMKNVELVFDNDG